MFDYSDRKYPRVNHPCSLTMWQHKGVDEIILADTADIGLGGLKVQVNHGVRVGTKVDIQLNFSNPPSVFKCKGVVRNEAKNKELYDVGIEFEPLSKPQHAFLKSKINELISLRKKGKS